MPKLAKNTNQTDDFGEAKFRRFAKSNQLRLQIAEDGFPTVVALDNAKWAEAHLFEGYGNQKVGLFVECHTSAAFSHMKNRLLGDRTAKGKTPMKCEEYSCGDQEGIFLVKYSDLKEVIKFFGFCKRKRVNNLK